MFSWFLKKKENDGQPFAVPVLMGKGQTAAEVHSPVKGTVRILLIPKRIRSFRIKLRAEDPVFSLEYPLTYPRRALFDDLNTPGGRLRVFLEKFLASARDTEITLPETIFIGVSGMSLFVKRTGIPDGGLAVRDMCREGRLTAEFTLAGSKARLFASQSGVIIYDRESVKADSARDNVQNFSHIFLGLARSSSPLPEIRSSWEAFAHPRSGCLPWFLVTKNSVRS